MKRSLAELGLSGSFGDDLLPAANRVGDLRSSSSSARDALELDAPRPFVGGRVHGDRTSILAPARALDDLDGLDRLESNRYQARPAGDDSRRNEDQPAVGEHERPDPAAAPTELRPGLLGLRDRFAGLELTALLEPRQLPWNDRAFLSHGA
jgi:hypothetical protein